MGMEGVVLRYLRASDKSLFMNEMHQIWRRDLVVSPGPDRTYGSDMGEARHCGRENVFRDRWAFIEMQHSDEKKRELW